MLQDKLKSYNIICGSGSPRRQYLLKELGLDFKTVLRPVDESFPSELKAAEIPEFLSKVKASEILPDLNDNDLLITADTIVWLENAALNKPVDAQDSKRMLNQLSGKMHQVFTGVTISTKAREVTFSAETKVWFKELTPEEIDFYVENFRPLDKAGAYGAQEWIGYVAVEKIEGTYFNVMGLPLPELYKHLMTF